MENLTNLKQMPTQERKKREVFVTFTVYYTDILYRYIRPSYDVTLLYTSIILYRYSTTTGVPAGQLQYVER